MQNNQDNINWFEEWFDSEYYHLLYKNRDDNEAEYFINNLINYLKPKKEAKMLDIACGKGRHAIFINKQGYTIDAFDLSENSIIEAKKNETDSLKFYINDIREPLKTNYYEFAFNIFTSFGYFTDEKDNQKSINSIVKCLKNDGILVIDFLNVNYILSNLKPREEKQVEQVTFNIRKEIVDGFIIKHIEFKDKERNYHFTEQVKLIRLADFKNYFKNAGLTILEILGDYSLNKFDEINSERLIIIAKK